MSAAVLHQRVFLIIFALRICIAATSVFTELTSTTSAFSDLTSTIDDSATSLSSLPSPPETASTHAPADTETVLWTSYTTDIFGSASMANSTTVFSESMEVSFSVAETTNATEMSSVRETIFPSTVTAMSSSAVPTTTTTTTPKPTTTTKIPEPIDIYQCKISTQNALPPRVLNAHWEILEDGHFLLYTCNDGFKQTGGNRWLQCGKVYGWFPKQDLIQCEEIKWEMTGQVPNWPVTLLTVLTVLLIIALVYLVILALIFCFLKFFGGLGRIVHVAPHEQTTKTTASGKGGNRRRWPWKRPARPHYPRGHFGPDGVAWVVNADNVAHPVKR